MKTLNERTAKFTRTALLSALLAAQLLTIDGALAESYSVDIVPGGKYGNQIAIQLINGNNTIAEILPNVPNGTDVWLRLCNDIHIGTFINGAWVGENLNLSLPPGRGISVWSPVAFTLTITGVRVTSPMPRVLAPGMWHILARQTPEPATYEDIIGYALGPGTAAPNMYKWNATLERWDKTTVAGIGEYVIFKVQQLSCPTEILVATDPGQYSARVTYSDNCGAIVFNPPSGSVFPIGTTPVTCVAIGASGSTETCSFTVTVLGPIQATKSLIGAVQALVNSGVLNQGNGNALTSKLEAAINQISQGNNTAAINQLQAFINQVNALLNAGKLTKAQADSLINAANEIIKHVGN